MARALAKAIRGCWSVQRQVALAPRYNKVCFAY